MGKWTAAVALIAVLATVPWAAAEETQEGAGVGFDLSGYYRVRYDNTFNMGWRFNEENRDGDENQDSDWWSYFDQRALFLPVMHVNERIMLKAQVDVLRNVLFGQNSAATIPSWTSRATPATWSKLRTSNSTRRRSTAATRFPRTRRRPTASTPRTATWAPSATPSISRGCGPR
ncbi:MAG: hypothetical protein M5R36_18845 [Deltaproteobacteria bacterium]|nr:hypothetical protein [Deltaproteobacteria bacterium]